MKCGHHESLRVRSVESDAELCELCDARQRRNDAEASEARLLKEKKALVAGIKELRRDVDNSPSVDAKTSANVMRRLSEILAESKAGAQ